MIDEEDIDHAPFPRWYGPSKILSFWEEDSNRTLALFGAKSRLPCGGVWFLTTNDKFAVCVEYAADSYNHMTMVEIFDETCPKWYELQRHLALYRHTIFVTKPKTDFLADLGITGKVGL